MPRPNHRDPELFCHDAPPSECNGTLWIYDAKKRRDTNRIAGQVATSTGELWVDEQTGIAATLSGPERGAGRGFVSDPNKNLARPGAIG